MEPERGRPGERGWTIVEVLLVAVVVGALLALALPNLLHARIRNDESAAVAALVQLSRAQEMLRRSATVDVDGDGRGEYGFLPELSGERNPRTFVPGRGGAGGDFAAPLPQFYLKVAEDGTAHLSGYVYQVHLPGPGGRAVGAMPEWTAPRTSDGVDPALAADTWCAYAWPARRRGTVPARSGERTFMVNQTGVVLASEAPYGDGSGEGRPAPGAAFLAPGPADTITGPAALGTTGRDGAVWRIVR